MVAFPDLRLGRDIHVSRLRSQFCGLHGCPSDPGPDGGRIASWHGEWRRCGSAGACLGLLPPSQVLYLSGIYTRAELALRIGLFYTAASLSGAFGGGSPLSRPASSHAAYPTQDCSRAGSLK